MKQNLRIISMIMLVCMIIGMVACENGNVGSETSDKDTEMISQPQNNTEEPEETPTEALSCNTDGAETEEHIHDWADATCTTARTCLGCGETEGEPLGHTNTATCLESASCDRCGFLYGGVGDHLFEGKVISNEYIFTVATMARPAIYFYSCVYCGKRSTKRFAHGGSIKDMLLDPYNKISEGNIDAEYYLYFTDPHSVATTEIASISDGNMKRIDKLGELYSISKAQFAICGGDWFNSSNSKESAIDMLKLIRNKMTETFGEKSYLVIGNHDTNYQIKDPDKGHVVSSPYRLTSEEIAATWFPEYGKTYYSVETPASKFYIFDSGIDWGHDGLTDLDKEQIIWYLEELLRNNDDHIVLAPHMIYTAKPTYNPCTQELAKISAVYNSRGSYTFEGKIFDFSEKSGMVEYIIAGHDHESSSGVLEGIPFIITTAMHRGAEPTADLVFANYTERKLYLTRLGDGESREIDLLPLDD